MNHVWTLGVLALSAASAVSCGSASTPTQMTVPRAVVRLTLPQQVVAVPSTDSRFAMEATLSMVASESAGLSAYINQWRVEATDEATGVTSNPPVFLETSVDKIPAGGSVEIPFRVGISGSGPHRIKVTLDITDSGGPSDTGSNGVPEGSWINPSGAQHSLVSSGECRILPPQ